MGDAEEACLWERLPRELQNKVLNHLPLKALFRARCVCKAWRHAILRRDFATTFDTLHTSETASSSILSLTSTSFSWLLYDSTHSLWQKATTLSPFFHSHLARQEPRFCSVHPVSGLLVLRFWEMGVNRWVVWNPLTSKWKMLPSFKYTTSRRSVTFVHAFVADETSRRYKIVVAHNPRHEYDHFSSSGPEGRRHMVTEVYDSATGAWMQSVSTLRFPVNEVSWMGKMREPRGVLHDGVIHFVAIHQDPVRVLYCFDTVGEQWREEVVPLEGCLWVFGWDGQVMTAVDHRLDEDYQGRWELVLYQWDPRMRRWADAGIRIPDKMTIGGAEFCTCDDRSSIVAEGNCLVASGRDSVHAVYWNAEDCWTHIAPCYGQVREPGVNYSRLFLFRPKLDWAP